MPSEHIVMQEITPLKEHDSLYIADRHKKEFDYPIHAHPVYELNFVEGAAGVTRIVGDSRETIGNYDLVLITGADLEHAWVQGDCHSDDIHEITVQFDFGMGENDTFFRKTAFNRIRNMFEAAQRGLAFPMQAIMQVYGRLDHLSKIDDNFEAVMTFVAILNDLASCPGAKPLATSSYARVEPSNESRQVMKVKNYIREHYMYELPLETVAAVAAMSKSAFSRFFKLHTGRTLSDYITDVRMGNAARQLIDTDDTVANISFGVGYNNLSNFNRTFRRLKGCTPSEFREQYRKTKVIV